MDNVYELPFGKFLFQDDYVIGTPDGQTNMCKEETDALIQLAEQHYTKPFFYVGNRLYGNSTNPLIVDKVKERLPLFSALALVYYTPKTKKLLELETKLTKTVPVAVFDNLDDALAWGHRQLDALAGD